MSDLDRLAARLRAEAPEQTAGYSDEALLERIETAVARCLDYDLATEDQILHFVRATLLLGEDFDAAPDGQWAAEILEDQEMSPDERAAMVAAAAEMLVEEQRS